MVRLEVKAGDGPDMERVETDFVEDVAEVVPIAEAHMGGVHPALGDLMELAPVRRMAVMPARSIMQVLTEYRPALICSEINEKIPPPLRFTVHYRPEYAWDATHFYGQSISQLSGLCRSHGYAIVELESNNAFLMPEDIAPASLTPEEAYRTGYLERPDRAVRFPYNADMDGLHAMEPAAAVEFLRRRFAPYEGMYSLDAG